MHVMGSLSSTPGRTHPAALSSTDDCWPLMLAEGSVSHASGLPFDVSVVETYLMIYQACSRPGSQPSMVKQMLMRKSDPQPRLKNTAS